jgi:uncharacterized protein (DUF1778 family)
MSTNVAKENSMPATARIPLQLEPSEKLAITKKARAHGVSVNDYVRSAVRSFDPESLRDEEIDSLLSQVKISTQRAEAALDDALTFIDASQKRIAEMERNAAKAHR